MNKLALLVSIISSPDVSELDTPYIGRCSWFVASPRSAMWFSDPTDTHYCACRFKYDALARQLHIERKDIKRYLHEHCVVKVMNTSTGCSVECKPIDWGPARKTGRAIDLSRGAMDALGAVTDSKLVFELRRVR